MNDALYGELLASIRPVLIETPEEHDRMLTAAEELMEKGDSLTSEERRALELLVFLIKSFEDSVMADDEEDEGEPEQVSARPHETLRRLLDARGMSPSDVEHVFGNPIACRDAMAGNRKISRGQAKALADLFRVPYKLFVE
jgi:antitoxin component HigA of HigAB toxin-antitoxin module